MVYIRADGTVGEGGRGFGFHVITDIFWAILNTIGLFFKTLLDPKTPIDQKKYKPRSLGFGSSTSSNSGSGTVNQRKGPNIKTLPKPVDGNCTAGG